jgi:hypothetical protein
MWSVVIAPSAPGTRAPRLARAQRPENQRPVSVVAQNVAGTGQTVGVYGQCATSSTLTIDAYAGGIELAAYQVG